MKQRETKAERNKFYLSAFLSLCFIFLCGGVLVAGEEDVVREISLRLIIEDSKGALEASLKGVEAYPQSMQLQHLLIRSLAVRGETKKALQAWKKYRAHGGGTDSLETDNLLEIVAWSLLKKGARTQNIVPRYMALVGAVLSRDAYAVPIVEDCLEASSASLRRIALNMAPLLGDEILKQHVLRLLMEETSWSVRLEAIRSAGRMNIKVARPLLEEIVGSVDSAHAEKVAAVLSLTAMQDDVSSQELLQLVRSPRAGLRLLACELVGKLALKSEVALIECLINDNHPTVRAAAFRALGLLKIDKEDAAKEALEDPDTQVAITAAWFLTVIGRDVGLQVLGKRLQSKREKEQLLAAAALSATGRQGISFIQEVIEDVENNFVKATLAMGLVGQNAEVTKACDILFDLFGKEKGQWMWKEFGHGFFRALAPSQVEQFPGIHNYPEVVNQMTRLEVLNVLAIKRYPHVQKAVRNFLRKGVWSLPLEAAALLLREGDETVFDTLEACLNDENSKVRLHAALALAIWGKDRRALEALHEEYPRVNRDNKIKILEAVGWIGAKESLPFLINTLEEPFHSLRIIAASDILQILRK